MRRAALALSILLLTACSAEKAATPPMVQATPDAVQAAPAQPELRRAEAYRVTPELRVRITQPATMYTGPGAYYLYIRDLPEGLDLTYISNREGWLRVKTPEGEVGYVSATGATLVDGQGQKVAYQARQGRWEMRAEAGPGVALQRLAPGVIQLTLTGLGTVPGAVSLPEGALLLPGPFPGAPRLAADVGEGGVTRVSISDKGVLVELEGSPVYAAAEAAPNRMVLVFRPGLQAVETTPAGWKLSYSGDLRPVLRQEGAQVIIDLPGAVTGKQGLPVETVGPEAGPAAQPANSPTAQVPTRMPAGGLRLKLPAMDGQPFALYRTAPGTLELRFLSPGLAGKAIVIDPGHGDEETGAVGPGGSAEKDVNLAVALKLRPLLEQAGAKVIMTRAEDRRVASDEALAAATSEAERTQIDLAARSALADQAGADLFLSIHSNGGEEGEGGTETYWATSNLNASLSRTLALLAQEELVEALGLYDRGAKQRAFNVIRMSDAPATLVELGFMTEPDEESLLLSAWGQEAAARALFRALERYFTP